MFFYRINYLLIEQRCCLGCEYILSDWFNQITPWLINEAFTKGIQSIWIVWKSMSKCVTILTKLELKFKKYFLVSKFSLDYLGYQFLICFLQMLQQPLNINWDVLTDTHISECEKIRILVDLDKLYFFITTAFK